MANIASNLLKAFVDKVDGASDGDADRLNLQWRMTTEAMIMGVLAKVEGLTTKSLHRRSVIASLPQKLNWKYEEEEEVVLNVCVDVVMNW